MLASLNRIIENKITFKFFHSIIKFSLQQNIGIDIDYSLNYYRFDNTYATIHLIIILQVSIFSWSILFISNLIKLNYSNKLNDHNLSICPTF